MKALLCVVVLAVVGEAAAGGSACFISNCTGTYVWPGNNKTYQCGGNKTGTLDGGMCPYAAPGEGVHHCAGPNANNTSTNCSWVDHLLNPANKGKGCPYTMRALRSMPFMYCDRC